MSLPQIIALCGNPTAGKTEVQKILQKNYGYIPVDDGGALRRFAIDALGLSEEDVYTQQGKLRSTEVLGVSWPNRKILGEIGSALERTFGAHIMPFMGTRNLLAGKRHSFGGVRRDQGAFYKSMGGVVIGVRNPLAGPSPYEFDQFDATLVDFWIENDALSRGLVKMGALLDLESKVLDVMERLEPVRLAA